MKTREWEIDIGRATLPPVERRAGQLTVLDVTKWFGETSGGVRTYLEQKTEYVASRPSLRHVLVIPSRRDLVVDRPQARWYRLRGPTIPSQPQYRFLLAPRSLRRIIAHEQPDIIEVGSPILVPWIASLAARGTKIPIVSFYHTNLLTLAGLPGWMEGAGRGALTAYARRLDRMFATTLVASAAVERDLHRVGIHRTTRVSLGVDLDTFHPRRRARNAELRAELGVASDRKLVTFAGRLAPEKSLDVAIDAFGERTLAERAELLIVGDGPLREALMERAKGRPVHFRPFESSRERLADLLAASDVCLAPGTVETFGLAPLEALACGTPVVSADAGSVPELVARSGAGGLYRTGNAASLAAELLRCLDVPRAEQGAAARAFVEREHRWDVVFDRLFDAYRTVLAA